MKKSDDLIKTKVQNNSIITKQELQEIIKTGIIEALKVERKTYTVEECAKYTGIGKDKIRELIARENTDFPYFKVGVKVVIPKEPLDRWLEKISMEKRQL